MTSERFYFFVQVKAPTQGYTPDEGVHHYESPRDTRGQYLHRYDSRDDAERAAAVLQSEGYETRIEISGRPAL